MYLIPYKDRIVEDGQKVQVYRNLNNKLFSIRCSKTKLVLGHGARFLIENPIGKVSQKGRERVLKEKVRNVHAWIEGKILFALEDWENTYTGSLVSYNPYYDSEFKNIEDKLIYFNTDGSVFNIRCQK